MPHRVHRNGHTLEIEGLVAWYCIHCKCWFSEESDADTFWCGEGPGQEERG